MAAPSPLLTFLTILSHLIVAISGTGNPGGDHHHDYCSGEITATDAERIHFALNLEFLEAEFFLRGAVGAGLDAFNRTLAKGGPPPLDGVKANLDPTTRRIVEEFGYQEIGHLRAITDTVGGIPRPLYNLTRENFAMIVDEAVGRRSRPRFDPYKNSLNYLLTAYIIPYVGLTAYVGTIPNLREFDTKALVAGLLGVEAGQDAVIRALLYERGGEKLEEYGITVAEITNRISILRNNLGRCGIKDEGLHVPLELGAENRTSSNVLSANAYSVSYPRTPPQVLRILYGTGDEHSPGGILPCGGNGKIAKMFLQSDARQGYRLVNNNNHCK